MGRAAGYAYIAATLGLTAFGQLILKWRVDQLGGALKADRSMVGFVLGLVLDPYILSGLVAAFAASLCWMAAMTRFPLSEAYPFMALNFVIVVLLSAWWLAEPVSMQRLAGVALIVIGTVVAARG